MTSATSNMRPTSAISGLRALEHPSVAIGSITIPVEIAATPEEIQKGLSQRKSLEASSGMLFVFDHNAVFKFWMKGMRFPIDIIWIDEHFKIIDITKNLMPVPFFGKLTFHSPQIPARYVLEVNAGFCEKNNLAIDNTVVFNSVATV